MPAVCAQYKRWRNYTCKRSHTHGHDKPSTVTSKRKRVSFTDCPSIPGLSFQPNDDFNFKNLSGPIGLPLQPPEKIQRSMTPPNLSSGFEIDDFENYFTDSLFDSLNQPYLFPDRDFCKCLYGFIDIYSDMI